MDTGGDVTKVAQLASKLIKNDQVAAIIGPSATSTSKASETVAVIPIAKKGQIPLVSCVAGIKPTESVRRWVFNALQMTRWRSR